MADSEFVEFSSGPLKKRRLVNSCDICRKRKIRCDSGVMPNNFCSNCIAFGSDCTHNSGKRAAKKAAEGSHGRNSPETFQTSVGSLINSILAPDGQYLASQDIHAMRRHLTDLSRHMITSGQFSSAISSPLNSPLPVVDARFFGKSSNVSFYEAALDLKNGLGSSNALDPPKGAFWRAIPGEPLSGRGGALIFPSRDALERLTGIFFSHVSKVDVFPVVHQQSFEKAVADGIHIRDPDFGAVLLCICSIASRYSYASGGEIPGWEWFGQVYPLRAVCAGTPSVWHVQLHYLAAVYLQGSTMIEASWTLIGTGLRLAQAAGAHRRLPEGTRPSIDSEQWKRVFWGLISSDILLSCQLGRARSLQSDSYDQYLPLECDDVYWESSSARTFAQPPGVPSYLTFWVSMLKLLDNLSFAQKVLYPAKQRSSSTSSHDLHKLTAGLNQWLSEIPVHLRWKPSTTSGTFFDQAASLNATYHYVQMVICRASITCRASVSEIPAQALASCVNAARSCCRILALHGQSQSPPLASSHHLLFHSGVMLQVNLWICSRLGAQVDVQSDLRDVNGCMRTLKGHGLNWTPSGRLGDLLEELLMLGESHFGIQSGYGTPGSIRAGDLNSFLPSWSAQSSGGQDSLVALIRAMNQDCLPSRMNTPHSGGGHPSRAISPAPGYHAGVFNPDSMSIYNASVASAYSPSVYTGSALSPSSAGHGWERWGQ